MCVCLLSLACSAFFPFFTARSLFCWWVQPCFLGAIERAIENEATAAESQDAKPKHTVRGTVRKLWVWACEAVVQPVIFDDDVGLRQGEADLIRALFALREHLQLSRATPNVISALSRKPTTAVSD